MILTSDRAGRGEPERAAHLLRVTAPFAAGRLGPGIAEIQRGVSVRDVENTLADALGAAT
jgi:hypothetical protein